MAFQPVMKATLGTSTLVPNGTPNTIEFSHDGELKALVISFERMMLASQVGESQAVPTGLGDYELKLNCDGDVALGMDPSEALSINFSAIRPFAIKIIVDGKNALTGLEAHRSPQELLHESGYRDLPNLQDYIVVPGQVNVGGGRVVPLSPKSPGQTPFKQFVTPSSTIPQIRLNSSPVYPIANIKFEVYPIHRTSPRGFVFLTHINQAFPWSFEQLKLDRNVDHTIGTIGKKVYENRPDDMMTKPEDQLFTPYAPMFHRASKEIGNSSTRMSEFNMRDDFYFSIESIKTLRDLSEIQARIAAEDRRAEERKKAKISRILPSTQEHIDAIGDARVTSKLPGNTPPNPTDSQTDSVQNLIARGNQLTENEGDPERSEKVSMNFNVSSLRALPGSPIQDTSQHPQNPISLIPQNSQQFSSLTTDSTVNQSLGGSQSNPTISNNAENNDRIRLRGGGGREYSNGDYRRRRDEGMSQNSDTYDRRGRRTSTDSPAGGLATSRFAPPAVTNNDSKQELESRKRRDSVESGVDTCFDHSTNGRDLFPYSPFSRNREDQDSSQNDSADVPPNYSAPTTPRLASGSTINQDITSDDYPPSIFNVAAAQQFDVQILDSADFHRLAIYYAATGQQENVDRLMNGVRLSNVESPSLVNTTMMRSLFQAMRQEQRRAEIRRNRGGRGGYGRGFGRDGYDQGEAEEGEYGRGSNIRGESGRGGWCRDGS